MSLRGLSYAAKQHLLTRLGNQKTQSKWNCYYSRVHIAATSLAGNVYTVAAGSTFNAFSYGRNGNDMATAGQAGTLSTPCDTNILTANQTIAGESVIIEGIGILALSASDANLLKQLDQQVSVTIKTNGTTDYLLGIPSMVPSPGGLFGSSEAWSVAPSIPDQLSRSVGAMSNGIPHVSNYLPLPEPMLWSSAGHGDSNFNIQLKVERAVNTIVQFGAAARTATNVTPAVGPVAAYTPPTAAQTFVDYMIVLIGPTVNPLSTN